jgi:hypothetical protein
MRRRRFLALGTGVGAVGLAGCTGRSGGGEDGTPPAEGTTAPADAALPDGIYVQRFRETVAMQGTTESGSFAVGLLYSVPHRFWTVTGTDRRPTPRGGDVHLMATVWDTETGRVLPETGVSVEIERGGELVSQEVIYPMLSQRMGFHYGGNFSLAGDGEYTGQVSVGGLDIRRTGAFRGRFDEPTTLAIPFRFDETEREKVRSEPLEQYGRRGAVRPMEMGALPESRAPAESALPGVLGTVRSDDAVFAVGETTPPAGIDGDRYLYASVRTRYNRLVLPAMGLSARLEADDAGFDRPLRRTLDPELGYHYGTTVPAAVADGKLTVTTEIPPQVARHEGYERAFLEMRPASLSV